MARRQKNPEQGMPNSYPTASFYESWSSDDDTDREFDVSEHGLDNEIAVHPYNSEDELEHSSDATTAVEQDEQSLDYQVDLDGIKTPIDFENDEAGFFDAVKTMIQYRFEGKRLPGQANEEDCWLYFPQIPKYHQQHLGMFTLRRASIQNTYIMLEEEDGQWYLPLDWQAQCGLKYGATSPTISDKQPKVSGKSFSDAEIAARQRQAELKDCNKPLPSIEAGPKVSGKTLPIANGAANQHDSVEKVFPVSNKINKKFTSKASVHDDSATADTSKQPAKKQKVAEVGSEQKPKQAKRNWTKVEDDALLTIMAEEITKENPLYDIPLNNHVSQRLLNEYNIDRCGNGVKSRWNRHGRAKSDGLDGRTKLANGGTRNLVTSAQGKNKKQVDVSEGDQPGSSSQGKQNKRKRSENGNGDDE